MHPTERPDRRRRFTARLMLVVALAFGLVATSALVVTRTSSAPPALRQLFRQDDPRWTAQQFLRNAAQSRFVAACLQVIDDGQVLNPCADDLRDRSAATALENVDERVTVVDVDVRGSMAYLSDSDLRPRSERPIELGLQRRSGRWHVYSLNGIPIRYRWQEWKYSDGAPEPTASPSVR